jgi:OmpA family
MPSITEFATTTWWSATLSADSISILRWLSGRDAVAIRPSAAPVLKKNEPADALSERRARAVRDYLVQNGVTDDGRIQTVGSGPVAADRR